MACLDLLTCEAATRSCVSAEHFEEMGEALDVEVAQKINALGIDILVFLDGHNSGSRLALLALHAAPVQVCLSGCRCKTRVHAVPLLPRPMHCRVLREVEAMARDCPVRDR